MGGELARVAVIVPCFNEADSLPALIAEFARAGFDSRQIAVVNDASSDATAKVARELGATLLDLPVNLGIGGAVQTGYRWALERGFEYAVQVDGDGQHPPSTVARLLERAEKSGADLVIGSRFVDASSAFRSSALRRLGIQWFSLLIRLLTGRTVHDTTSGLRLCRRGLYARFGENYPMDYPEPETLAWALSNGFRVEEVGVPMRERRGGSSSIANLRPLYYMVKVTLGILFGRSAR